MGDEVKDFQIKIVTSADLKASQDSAKALQDVGTATKASAAAASEDGKNTEELTRKTGFLSLKKTELKRLVRELGHEFPIAGMAGRMMMNPIIAGLSLGIMAFSAAKRALDDWNAKLDAAAARNASRDFFPGIQAQKDSLDQAKASAAEFATALGNIGAAEDKFKTSVSQAIDKLHEFTNAQAEVNSSAEALELAQVDLKQKTGKLDDVGAIKQRAAIKERYRKTQDDLKSQGEQDEIKLQETELQHDKDSQKSLAEAAADARKKRDALKARREKAQKDLEEGKKKELEYGQEFEEAAAANDEDSQPAFQSPYAGELGRAQLNPAAAKRLDDARRQRDAQRKFNKANEDLIENLDQSQLPKAEGAASVADARAKSNAERINELERTLPAKKEVIGIREQGREAAGRTKDRTTETEATAQIAQELKQGQEKQAHLQQQILSAARSGGPVTAEVLKAFQEQESFNKKVAAELAAQSQRLREMEGKPPRI
jgi:hypothetical protein